MSDKPSDWIRNRASEYMPEGWGLGMGSRPDPQYEETIRPWVRAIVDYLDHEANGGLSVEDKEEIAGQLNEILERIDE